MPDGASSAAHEGPTWHDQAVSATVGSGGGSSSDAAGDAGVTIGAAPGTGSPPLGFSDTPDGPASDGPASGMPDGQPPSELVESRMELERKPNGALCSFEH